MKTMSETASNSNAKSITEATSRLPEEDSDSVAKQSESEMSSNRDEEDDKQVQVENTNRIESETSSSGNNDGSSDSSNPIDNANSNEKDSLTGSETGNETESGHKKKKLDRSKLRKGKWTTEEEEYSSRIIHYFRSGLITLPEGATLRSYLADKLNCDPMRVTKKYAGAICLGRRYDHLMDRKQPTIAEIQIAKVELDHLEQRFRARVGNGKAGHLLPPRIEFIFAQPRHQNPPFLAPNLMAPAVPTVPNQGLSNDMIQKLSMLLNPLPQVSAWNLQAQSHPFAPNLPMSMAAPLQHTSSHHQTPSNPGIDQMLSQLLATVNRNGAQIGRGNLGFDQHLPASQPPALPQQQDQAAILTQQLQQLLGQQSGRAPAPVHSASITPPTIGQASQPMPSWPTTFQQNGSNIHSMSDNGSSNSDGNMLLGFLNSLRASYEEALKAKETEQPAPSQQLTQQSLDRHKKRSNAAVVSDLSGESLRNNESSIEDSDWNSDKKTDPSSSEDSDKEAKSEDSDKEVSTSKGPPRKRIKSKSNESVKVNAAAD